MTTAAVRKVTLEVTLPDQFLSDVLTTAVESGHNSVWYWAEAETVIRAAQADGSGLDDLSVVKVVGVRDREDSSQNAWGDVTLDTVCVGIQRLLNGSVTVAPYLLGYVHQALTNQDGSGPDAGFIDSDAADCIVQAGLFSEIVYG